MALIGSLGEIDLGALDASIADTAVDIFVYDTRKDSDGGAWRKRTQHTSWYNETLNTATRGSRRDFPAVAVIVAEVDQVTIYDGDDPDLPMWMVFYSQSFGLFNNNNPVHTILSVSALNGVLCGGGNQYSCVGIVNFVADTAFKQSANSGTYAGLYFRGMYLGNIAQRNSSLGFDGNLHGYSDWVVSDPGNDVAMTVLPNATIDSATGLPIPTIAVATSGGVSVIKDDGTVVDLKLTNSYCVEFTSDYKLIASINTQPSTFSTHVYDTIPSSDSDTNGNRLYYRTTTSGAWSTPPLSGNNNESTANETRFMSDNLIAIPCIGTSGTIPALNILQDISPQSSAMVAYATTSYNTGWMHGDIKGAFLSDTDATNVTGTELVTNGTFTTDLTGWSDDSEGNGTASVVSSALRLYTPTQSSEEGRVSQQITTLTSGKTYVLSATTDAAIIITVGVAYIGASELVNQTITGPAGLTFTATSSSVYLTVRKFTAGTANVDNVSVRLAEEDRSVNNKGLQVFGTINKSAVATGAELVAYSGFSGSNHLIQPYNSDLNFGTGDFSAIAWVKKSTLSTNHYVFDRGDGGASNNNRFGFIINQAGSIYFFAYNGSGTIYNVQSGNGLFVGSNNWRMIHVVRRGGTTYLGLDGADLYSNTNLNGVNITGSGDEPLVIGQYNNYSAFNVDYAVDAISLLRFSASAPSPEQIKKMYEDERVLFQENAACTLYGSSDAVTALAYDEDYETLYVGTSSGRSDFRGLRRINNTTTAVTTAISASNGLVAEQ